MANDRDQGPRRRAVRDYRDGVQVCSYGYCLAPVAGRRGSPYCSDEHAKLAKNRKTLESRAAQVARDYLESAAQGNELIPQYQGWLRNQDGILLSGAAVIELKAIVQPVASGQRAKMDVAKAIGEKDLQGLYLRYMVSVGDLVDALDEVFVGDVD